MDEQRFLRVAIELARDNLARGGQPFGALVVKEMAKSSRRASTGYSRRRVRTRMPSLKQSARQAGGLHRLTGQAARSMPVDNRARCAWRQCGWRASPRCISLIRTTMPNHSGCLLPRSPPIWRAPSSISRCRSAIVAPRMRQAPTSISNGPARPAAPEAVQSGSRRRRASKSSGFRPPGAVEGVDRGVDLLLQATGVAPFRKPEDRELIEARLA